eukprot:scaffold1237_cov243-Pinguiococcus_pyrenoidosus.AAC.20
MRIVPVDVEQGFLLGCFYYLGYGICRRWHSLHVTLPLNSCVYLKRTSPSVLGRHRSISALHLVAYQPRSTEGSVRHPAS